MAHDVVMETFRQTLEVDKANLLGSLGTHGLGEFKSLGPALKAVSAEHKRLQDLGILWFIQCKPNYPAFAPYTPEMLWTYMTMCTDMIERTKQSNRRLVKLPEPEHPLDMRNRLVQNQLKGQQSRMLVLRDKLAKLKRWHRQQPQLQQPERFKTWHMLQHLHNTEKVDMEHWQRTEQEIEKDFLEYCSTDLPHFSHLQQQQLYRQQELHLRHQIQRLSFLRSRKTEQEQQQQQEQQQEQQQQQEQEQQPPPSLEEEQRHEQKMRDEEQRHEKKMRDDFRNF